MGLSRGWYFRRDAPLVALVRFTCVEILIKKRLELASVFPIALEAEVMMMGFEPELFDVPTAT